MEKYQIDEHSLQNIYEDIDQLSDFFTDRIEEMHKVPGVQTERHVFLFYRNILNGIQRSIETSLTTIIPNDQKSNL